MNIHRDFDFFSSLKHHFKVCCVCQENSLGYWVSFEVKVKRKAEIIQLHIPGFHHTGFNARAFVSTLHLGLESCADEKEKTCQMQTHRLITADLAAFLPNKTCSIRTVAVIAETASSLPPTIS
ncbi:hypothetical protein WJU23_02445 [Prosthecobacter sp. SYSU 5D2]|uniref:hypothetical protein n=1 Tax=Prosthecobacter sp. SYSU 5D2 TaxID=3134134 RepID=UPI0031FF1106